ncbi:hypothetical protein Talka_01408 [Tepidimonas alkaliphilus]|uniref:DUF2061 domain-containing protein n=1 Tax=Tepidimonas alkaliphilus TaxID=2588942 RepID=A0A554W7Z0_9BURK|nr:DUF2061 domain-containing protein [Tepidimonas alkaliphilus]TSE19689.1 hypothetical protein Talka_01408 [Tepidimonas alkaliphilus]
MARLRRIAQTHRLALMKTATYYVMHITVAMAVAYAVTGSWLAALTLSLLEPTVQAVAYFFHERAWARVENRRADASAVGLTPQAACGTSG